MILLSEGLKDFCQPLKDLGIHLFNVMINYDDNRQVYLCNNPQWVHDYYHHELHQSSFYDNRPALFNKNEYNLWEDQSQQPIMQYGLNVYDNRYGVTIIHRHTDFSAFYFFAGSSAHHYLPQFFINNFTFLEGFIHTFINKNKELIDKAHKLGLQRHSKPANSPWGEDAVNLLLNEQEILSSKCELIQQELTFNTRPSLLDSLSPRQKQVLYGLTKGESAQKIAEKLNISRRTVERHLSLLKCKFPNHSYIELILELLNAEPTELLLNKL
ncbi:LuxR C-terminal-related transcriptional regulator [Legionella sp. km772]|uniref:LuxR C-terminal-related transcriptional regulator n=1 Tax=Legionella sp. km772 TaxID=2498111 RepID=UPI001F1787B8|nr:LuxR C-terminal-related transcriptional regulator [Legionella sp. km772]